jgi:hypothetical protein
VHYIYDSSLSWLDTITSVESSKPMSLWNEAVMQCTIYTYIYITAHYPGLIQELQQKFPMSYWNEVVMQCTVNMTAHYPSWIQELQ